jgi:hypothetical protein
MPRKEDDLDENMEDLENPAAAEPEDTEDGGAVVDLDEAEEGSEPNAADSGFYDNLAMTLDQAKLDKIANDLIEKVKFDEAARKKRDERYAEGIRRTGLSDDAPGGASFTGSSKVVHPMLSKAAIDFESRAMKEVFPAMGPAKSFIPGRVTKARLEKSERKARFFNWQLTHQIQEFRDELEQVLTQTSLAGAAYLRIVWNGRFKRPSCRSITEDRVLLPHACTSFYTAERITFLDDITEFEYRERVVSGLYLDVDLQAPSMVPEQSKTGEQMDKVSGKTSNQYNEDGLRRTYEINTYLDKVEKGQEGPLPFIVCIDEASHSVMSVIRNWEEIDEKQERMHWLIEWPFVPWEGATRLGFVQLIGGLSAGTTGSLRALLDSAHINNFPTAVKLKGAASGGQSKTLNPTEIVELDGGVGADDIRKLVMQLPYNPPSPVLYQLMGFLIGEADDVVRTTFDSMATDGSNPAQPVGTTMALIEQGLTVISNIMGRMHHSMAQTLRVLHRIDRMYIEEQEILDEAGELLIKRSDLEGPLDVIPVSDPSIPSDAHRFAQTQSILQRSTLLPQIYDLRKVEKMFLERMRVANPEDLLIPVPEPKEMNAANENAAMALGRPVTAFPEQDHLAHIQTLLDFVTSPMLGQLPIIAPTFLPRALDHLKEHMVMWYVTEVYRVTSEAVGKPLEKYMEIEDKDTKNEIERLIATASTDIVASAGKMFGKLPPIIQSAIQIVQQYQPQGQDPQTKSTEIMAQVQRERNQGDMQVRQKSIEQQGQLKQAELAQRNQEAQMRRQEKESEMQLRLVEGGKKSQDEMQLEAIRQRAEDKRAADKGMESAARLQHDQQALQQEAVLAQAQIESKERINTQDNTTAMEIASAEIESGEKVAVSKGTGLNPGS